jgi:hypothetical protein
MDKGLESNDNIKNINSDSVLLLNNAISAYKNDIKIATDSATRYNLLSISDTCIKLTYTVFKDELIKRDNRQMPLFESGIKLTQVKHIEKSQFRLYFITFIDDSIPAHPGLSDKGGYISEMFDVDTLTKEIKVIHTSDNSYYSNTKNVIRTYHDILKSDSFNLFIKTNKFGLNPIFQRLLRTN